MTRSVGYSGTPLASKLGLRLGTRLALVEAPDTYRDLVAPWPEDVECTDRITPESDLVHVFAVRRADLARHLATARDAIRPDAAVWVSWPKKSSKVPTDITEDTIRELCLRLGFVDVKVCAVSDVWSGLKLVIRRELR